jgi:cyclohexanone monooxygenase
MRITTTHAHDNNEAATANMETAPPEIRELETLILGAGVSGVAAAIGLLREGVDDFEIIDRADDVGGTWHHNRYPGCACDIPSHVYSFSFAPNPDWDRVFSTQPQIAAYVKRVARQFGIYEHLRTGVELLDANWNEREQRWVVHTSAGPYHAGALVIGAGPLHEPIIPELPGLGSFDGQVFHSSHWPTDLDLDGRRVVVVGNGASAIQFVPQIQPRVARLTILQRTPSWVMPKLDWRTSRLERRLLRRFTLLMRVMRMVQWGSMDVFMLAATRHPRIARMSSLIARAHMRLTVSDPELRRKITPTYAVTCKRLGLSNDYLPALDRPNVELVTSAAAEVRPGSVVCADGSEHPADTIIFGTGFHVLTTHPIAERIRGRDGRTLAEVWDGSPKAYMGTTMAGFPNAFMMFGPNAGTLSGFTMAEAQTDYLVGAMTAMRREGLTSIDVRPEAQEAFVKEVDRVLEGSTFVTGGCNSYYLDKTGRVALAWPWSMTTMRRRLARFDLTPYATKAGHTDAAGTQQRPAPARR